MPWSEKKLRGNDSALSGVADPAGVAMLLRVRLRLPRELVVAVVRGDRYTRQIWHPNGWLDESIPYVNGKAHGIARSYYHDGLRRTVVPLVAGKKHGLGIRWRQDGSVVRETTFENDLRVLERWWDAGGTYGEITFVAGHERVSTRWDPAQGTCRVLRWDDQMNMTVSDDHV